MKSCVRTTCVTFAASLGTLRLKTIDYLSSDINQLFRGQLLLRITSPVNTTPFHAKRYYYTSVKHCNDVILGKTQLRRFALLS